MATTTFTLSPDLAYTSVPIRASARRATQPLDLTLTSGEADLDHPDENVLPNTMLSSLIAD